MALHESFDTDDGAVPEALRRFVRRRAYELCGLIVLAGVTLGGLALASWNATDPSFDHATVAPAQNWLGYPGAVVADLLAQYLGLGSLVFLLVPLAWSYRLISHRDLNSMGKAALAWLFGTISFATLVAGVPSPQSWPLAVGLGGQLGDSLFAVLAGTLALGLKTWIAAAITGAVSAVLAAYGVSKSIGLTPDDTRAGLSRTGWAAAGFANRTMQAAGVAVGAGSSAAAGIARLWQTRPRAQRLGNRSAQPEEDILTRLAPARGTLNGKRKVEPALLPADHPQDDGDEALEELSLEDEALDAEEEEDVVAETPEPVKPARKAPRASAARQQRPDVFELPELELLSEPKRPAKSQEVSAEVLEHNARLLEGVLEDFGVKGQIIDVKPGPVVTLYELEPAPGIKSSRVISLADDIARSMSAISARVAVVQGRNAIGIELPNAKRETVFLREMFVAEPFAKSTANLVVALGKNIGGEPIYADLARMPHLLIAGTTGSGKSVGINTMILSLLYRLPPDRCKLIMIDPKMLELSVYEGIPHLLAPVVTDPRKAVVALKWAVKEMEDRYKKMSKVGVRNIDGYNTRVGQMAQKGEKFTRTVQTGFDPLTGQPIFEHEEMEVSPMPFIVVIIDEMADLMMVAGKDIEGAVQRLAQMARAAGIHVIMATQRPSVDVITGTIKANFPTRISFQVTSKIDSRTILGEQGAEQLLGQGDMLYMAGGGRISRLHGPFVSDQEVEAIVKHLKAQGAPDYVEAVTEEPEEADMLEGGGPEGGSGDDLYDQAVAVVLRDKKVSTSYIQRRLQVGYNKAASLIERMEKEGLISAANATGKREILVPGDSARV